MSNRDYILEYLEDLLKIEENSLNSKNFIWSVKRRKSLELYSYNKATIRDLIDEIRDSELPPIMVIEEFIKKMDIYACAARNPKEKFIFSTSYDMAVHIEDVLLIRHYNAIDERRQRRKHDKLQRNR